MASLLETAQSIIKCQLCEVESKTQWKCIDCGILMCIKCCEKIHPKFKNAKDHRIISIKDIGLADLEPKMDFTDIKCKNHDDQACCLYCSSCEQMVCPICVPQYHTGHYFTEIKEFYQKMYDLLQSKIQRLHFRQDKLSTTDSKFKNLKVQETVKFDNLLKAIETQRNTLKEIIDDYAESHIRVATIQQEQINETLSSEEDKIMKEKQTLTESMEKFQKVMETKSASEFFNNLASAMKNQCENSASRMCLTYPSMPKFEPGSICEENFGHLKEDEIKMPKITLKVKKDFVTKLGYCHDICSLDNGFLLIGQQSLQSGRLQIVNPNDNNLPIINKWKNISLYDLCSHSNEVFMADKTAKLKVMQENRKDFKSSIYNVKGLLVVAVDIIPKRYVLVAARSTEKPFPIEGRRVVIKMNWEGKEEKIWEHDSFNQRIFCSPRQVCFASNENVFVIDRLSDYANGKVLCLKDEGEIVNSFYGHQDFIKSDSNEFKPSKLARTPSGNMMVSDYLNSAIYLLDNSGELLSAIDTTTVGILAPICMTFASDNIIYIGCTQPSSSTEKAKIYETEFHET